MIIPFGEFYILLKSCSRITDGEPFSGSIQQLDYLGKPEYHKNCSDLMYGFMGGECTEPKTVKVVGCSKGNHSGTVIGAFLDPPSEEPGDDGQNHG